MKEFAINSNYCVFCQQIDVKANSDLKHVKDALAAEKKKKKTLLKSFDDVSLCYYCNCVFLQLYQKLGAASQLTFTSWKREDSEFHCSSFLIACTSHRPSSILISFSLLHSFTLSKDQSQLKNKEKELKKLSDLLVKLEQTSQADSNAAQAAQDHFHAVSAGLSSNEAGEDKTLADQVMSMFTCAPVLCLNNKL